MKVEKNVITEVFKIKTVSVEDGLFEFKENTSDGKFYVMYDKSKDLRFRVNTVGYYTLPFEMKDKYIELIWKQYVKCDKITIDGNECWCNYE